MSRYIGLQADNDGVFKFMQVRLFFIVLITSLFIGCAIGEPDPMEAPNYDNLIGKNFSDSIFKGRHRYKKIRETTTIEELENRRLDGCILVFGVRKVDDVIEYWRIDSGSDTCKVHKRPINA
jgi:hypothetical protein